LARHGASVRPDDVILTASTSEAYSYLFKLLCDPGDEVLVPVPSYPLFEHLARLENVTLRSYALEYHGRWSIGVETLWAAFTSRTRALIVVTPNNPTGSFLRSAQWPLLMKSCHERGVALICDEVFIDYALYPLDDAVRSVLSRASGMESHPLVFSLGGLSKSVGLPQHKLGWMVLQGPAEDVNAARDRLEWICDSYLSVNTPVQLALPRLLASGALVRTAIASRIRRNFDALQARIGRSPACACLPVEGGWTAVIRVPSVRSEENLVIGLLEEQGVLAYPGYFFDFASEAYVVVSLLPQPEIFDDGIDRVCRKAEA
jgi:aspartate/methionine/tyrosine aminotransferase